jgi:hypothetical protein
MRGAALHGQAQDHDHAVGVEQREGAHHHFLAVPDLRIPRPHLQDVGHDVAVEGHRPFREAGGPACILEDGHVIRSHLHRRPLVRPVAPQQVLEPDVVVPQRHAVALFALPGQGVEDLQERAHVFLDVDGHHAAHRGVGLDGFHPLVDPAEDNGRRGTGVGELVFQLAGRVDGVGGHHDAADLLNGEVGDDELRDVRHDQSHPIPFAYPQLMVEGRGQAVRELVELPVSHDAPGEPLMGGLEDQGRAVGEPPGGILQEAEEGDGWIH